MVPNQRCGGQITLVICISCEASAIYSSKRVQTKSIFVCWIFYAVWHFWKECQVSSSICFFLEMRKGVSVAITTLINTSPLLSNGAVGAWGKTLVVGKLAVWKKKIMKWGRAQFMFVEKFKMLKIGQWRKQPYKYTRVQVVSECNLAQVYWSQWSPSDDLFTHKRVCR